MNARFNPQAEDLQHLQVGPIGPHLQSFAALVTQQGYCNMNGWLKIWLVAKLSRWLHRRRIPLNKLNEAWIATCRRHPHPSQSILLEHHHRVGLRRIFRSCHSR